MIKVYSTAWPAPGCQHTVQSQDPGCAAVELVWACDDCQQHQCQHRSTALKGLLSYTATLVKESASTLSESTNLVKQTIQTLSLS